MSYEPPVIDRNTTNTTNNSTSPESSTNIHRAIYDLFKDMCEEHELPITPTEHVLLDTLLESLITNTSIHYEINNTDSSLIKFLKHICNGNTIHLLDTNLYLKVLNDLLYIYNKCKDCVTCVKVHALPEMKKRGVLPIFKIVIDYLIDNRPNIISDSNRKQLSVLYQKYHTYVTNKNVAAFNIFNVTTIEDIELYRKLYAVEKKAFESLIGLNSELKILYIGSGWAPPRYQKSIMYQFPLLLHGYIPDNNILTEFYEIEFEEHRYFRDTVLRKHITTIDYNESEMPDIVNSYNTYNTSQVFDIIILNSFTVTNIIELYHKYQRFLTVNGCILTYENIKLPLTDQYIIIKQFKKYTNNVNKTNNVLNKGKKGVKSEIQLFNKNLNGNLKKIPMNKTIENIFRMTNSFNEVKHSASDKSFLFYYNCADVAQLLNAPLLNAPRLNAPLLNAPAVNTIRQLLAEVFPNDPKKVNEYRKKVFKFGHLPLSDITKVEDIDLNNVLKKNDMQMIVNKIISMNHSDANNGFGGGNKSINLKSKNMNKNQIEKKSKNYIKIKGGKRLLRIGPKGGKYYMKGGNKKYIK